MQVVYHRYVSERKVSVFGDTKVEGWFEAQQNSVRRIFYLLGMSDELPPEGFRCVFTSCTAGLSDSCTATRSVN